MAEKLIIEVSAKDKNASSVLGKIGSGLKSAAAIGITSIAGLATGVGALGFKLLQLGSDAEESGSKFNIVFGAQAAGVTQELQSYSDIIGGNIFKLKEYAATIQDTLVPMGLSQDAAADLSVQTVKLAADLASFNNMPMDEALQRLQSTIIGNHENALAFGVVINENTLKAELAAQGWDNLTGSQLEAAKAQARLNLVMAGTAAAQGDAINTAGSFANQMKALQNSVAETATTMGTQLLPVVLPFLQSFVQWVNDVGPRAIAIFSEFAQNLSATAGPAMLLINDALTRMGEALGITSGEVSGTDVLLAALSGTLDAIVIGIELFAIAMQGAAWAVEQVVKAMDQAVALGDQIGTIFSAIGNLGSGPSQGFGGLGNVMMDGKVVGEITGGHQGNQASSVAAVGGPAFQ